MKHGQSDRSILKRAKEVLRIESQAVRDQIPHLDSSFVKAVEMLHEATERGGQVVVMGMGKSGFIGRKIAATLSSTGTPAVFFHPSEGLHGDLGIIRDRDIVLALSSSGETEEIKAILPILKERRLSLVAMTRGERSKLGRAADVVIRSAIREEACPLNLTPTASTTAMLALGDAVAMALMEKNEFRPSDFARLHPGGAIGKKLSLTVGDLMHRDSDNPVIDLKRTVREALLEMTRTRLGATNVVNGSGKLVGFFTDGDLRRKLQKDSRLLEQTLEKVMTKDPISISPDKSLYEALKVLKNRRVDNLPVVNGTGKPVGVLDERDLLAEGII